MNNGLLIHVEKFSHFPIYWEAQIWLCTWSHLNVLIYEENFVILISCLSVQSQQGDGALSVDFFHCREECHIFHAKDWINRSICFGSPIKKAYRTYRTIENVTFSAFPKRWELCGWKKTGFYDKIAVLCDCGLRPPLLDRRGWERSAKTRFQHLLWCERNKVSVYIYIAFIF